MKIIIFKSFLVCLILIISPIKIFADKAIDFYLNDFYSKSNKASQILKEIEKDLKDGSREGVCTRQREAARLGLLANKALIKAFEFEGAKPPIKEIKRSQERWESILNEC